MGGETQQLFLLLSALLLFFSQVARCQFDTDCISDELHYLPRLPDFFEFVPIRRHAAQLTTEIDATIADLLTKFSEAESTCLCNATSVNRIIMANARLCPRTSSNIAFDTQHCVRATPNRGRPNGHVDDRALLIDENGRYTGRHDNKNTNGRGGTPWQPKDSYGRNRGGGSSISGPGDHGNGRGQNPRAPGIIDGRWLKNTTSITPMTSRQSTSNINLHILIGIVVISAILIIVLFGSMVWWMRKRDSYTINTSFAGDCKRWFTWCKWSQKNLALGDAPNNGPFNNPVFCVGHDGDRDDREDERNVLSTSFESSAKRDSGYVGLPGSQYGGINGVPVLDLQMSPYRCYRPLRCDPADISRDADDISFNDSDCDTESVIVTPSSQCSFITFNLDTSRDAILQRDHLGREHSHHQQGQHHQILKPPLQTSV